MRVRMLRSASGSPDGTNTYHYEAGRIYTTSAPDADGRLTPAPLPLSARLAVLFVAEGWAEDADASQEPVAQQPITTATVEGSEPTTTGTEASVTLAVTSGEATPEE